MIFAAASYPSIVNKKQFKELISTSGVHKKKEKEEASKYTD